MSNNKEIIPTPKDSNPQNEPELRQASELKNYDEYEAFLAMVLDFVSLYKDVVDQVTSRYGKATVQINLYDPESMYHTLKIDAIVDVQDLPVGMQYTVYATTNDKSLLPEGHPENSDGMRFMYFVEAAGNFREKPEIENGKEYLKKVIHRFSQASKTVNSKLEITVWGGLTTHNIQGPPVNYTSNGDVWVDDAIKNDDSTQLPPNT